mmetsp:Transcript_46441/g.120135  ORF Transcript_46441/g.120135 Transcript_46441/m.120135 type:complete len:237 (-) Transcript_46441:3423-4133(-)
MHCAGPASTAVVAEGPLASSRRADSASPAQRRPPCAHLGASCCATAAPRPVARTAASRSRSWPSGLEEKAATSPAPACRSAGCPAPACRPCRQRRRRRPSPASAGCRSLSETYPRRGLRGRYPARRSRCRHAWRSGCGRTRCPAKPGCHRCSACGCSPSGTGPPPWPPAGRCSAGQWTSACAVRASARSAHAPPASLSHSSPASQPTCLSSPPVSSSCWPACHALLSEFPCRQPTA